MKKTIRVRSWDDFQRAIRQVRQQYATYSKELKDGGTYERDVRILFRGQSSATWPLETTLERRTKQRFDVLSYMDLATRGVNEIESFTGRRWGTKDLPDIESEIRSKQCPFRVHLPSYDYLVHLRHHGFPSPLLDWTESPFIAAYFACIDCGNKSPAVYCYIERPEMIKMGIAGAPMISVKGPFVTTDKRHFAQKAWYTVATQWNASDEMHHFCPHEEVFDQQDPRQDVLIRIVLPAAARRDALLYLNDHNINHFTLFQSETSLIKAIETKEFDLNGA